MRVILLGTGAAGGIPLFRCDCAVCARARALTTHARRPCSALVEAGGTSVMIDAGRTDLADVLAKRHPAAILLTHYHVDHVQGLFELRWGRGEPLPVIGPDDPDGCADLYRHSGMLDFSPVATALETFPLGALRITPVRLNHSKPCLGYVIEHEGGRLAYLTDTVGLPDASAEYLAGNRPDLVVIDCSHPPSEAAPRNHNSLIQALAIRDRLQPARTVLTHIGHEMDQWLLEHEDELPADVELGWDELQYIV